MDKQREVTGGHYFERVLVFAKGRARHGPMPVCAVWLEGEGVGERWRGPRRSRWGLAHPQPGARGGGFCTAALSSHLVP